MSALAPLLRAKRAQHRLNLAEKERELAIALREVAELRLKLAQIEAFAVIPSPSALRYPPRPYRIDFWQ
jgi:hypothetical protein